MRMLQLQRCEMVDLHKCNRDICSGEVDPLAQTCRPQMQLSKRSNHGVCVDTVTAEGVRLDV